MQVLDQYGREIIPGDVITYPGRRGGRMWMTTAIVLETREKKKSWSNAFLIPALSVVSVSEQCDGSYVFRKVEVLCIENCTRIPFFDILGMPYCKGLFEKSKPFIEAAEKSTRDESILFNLRFLSMVIRGDKKQMVHERSTGARRMFRKAIVLKNKENNDVRK